MDPFEKYPEGWTLRCCVCGLSGFLVMSHLCFSLLCYPRLLSLSLDDCSEQLSLLFGQNKCVSSPLH